MNNEGLTPSTFDPKHFVSETTIVIVKGLPVLQCNNCSEYLLEDPVLKQVEIILDNVDTSAELEVINYAA